MDAATKHHAVVTQAAGITDITIDFMLSFVQTELSILFQLLTFRLNFIVFGNVITICDGMKFLTTIGMESNWFYGRTITL